MGGGGEMQGSMNDTNSLFIDAHVLASPTIADVNGDGYQEMIIPISYYFDKAKYDGIKKQGVELDFEPEMYVCV